MKVDIDGLQVLFPYDRMYAEQLQYMRELKRALDAHGHCMLEMPTGTGKTISLLALVLAYKHAHPSTCGKLVYCTRTVPEMAKCVEELKHLMEYRKRILSVEATQITAVCLSSRRNMCIHEKVLENSADGETVDSQCRKMTASWVRARVEQGSNEQLVSNGGIELCSFYEQYEARKQDQQLLPSGVYSLDDLKRLGKEKGWCPYFLTRHVVNFADVIVYNYQYMLDPKVSQLVSRAFEKESIIVFDEAHNIDNVCIEALSVDLNRRSLDRASRNLGSISTHVQRLKQADRSRLDAEYRRLVEGLRASNNILAPTYENRATGQAIDTTNDILTSNPVLPDDVLEEAIPGNIRRAEHFIAFMRRLIEYLRTRLRVRNVESETPQAFLHHLNQVISMETKPMKFCYTRLNSLLRTLEITKLEEFQALTDVANFATLLATYADGFMLIVDPLDNASGAHDPVLHLACLDASLAIRPVLERFSSVIITSGTLSPIDLYPRLLNFSPVIRESLPMSVYRSCICPLTITRGSDQMPVSTKFDLRDDLSVVRNYGTLLLEMAAHCPDGMVCFFPSYLYMEKIIGQWDQLGVLKRVLQFKLLFIETTDIVETTLALNNYKKACDCGRGAIFFSVARGKVAEGIDFDRHYGRCVILFGIPFQYTLSHKLRARLEYLRYTHQIREADFLTFDALRQAAQCAGRVLRSKTDYGLILFADSRYNRADKRSKLPPWIKQFMVESHLNLSVDMAVHLAKRYLALMAQPVDEKTNVNSILLDEKRAAEWLVMNSIRPSEVKHTGNGIALQPDMNAVIAS
ncbi:unnamed protein product [Albugo candida]|uniref:DNA 5'-3' helicase n=1 Tax=Albugo candida TaxID=65357 RepID=A0A024GI23_9STRA|nr:unnamed protein product [Albugo candida]|eukprot:CCI45983.1 unnamed protein product [Albugo candida]